MQTEINVREIKESLEECLALLRQPSMQGIRKAVERSLGRIDQPMQLAIIGKISSSKSTLVNAILGKENLMQTGMKEVTYNVGWLKYGRPDSEIVIHYKDGRPSIRKSRKEFDSLTADTSHNEIDEISYIELFDDSEILKDVNIIDTPGLDANRQKDSRNTLDFISKVRPDAVVMLYTHSIAENVLDIVAEFNSGTELSPLNAIGLLSKIDVLWQETIPRKDKALQIGRKMVEKKKKKESIISRTLFDLYPVSALLYLASSSVTENDIAMITSAYESAPQAFFRALASMRTFLEEPSFSLTKEDRKKLAEKMGLYGIWLIAERLKSGESVDINSVRKLFMEESGAEEFKKTLYNHFGNRAFLIKIEGIYQDIMREIGKTKSKISSGGEASLLSTIEQKVADLFSTLVSGHREYETLRKLYDGTLRLDEETSKEMRRICGESGHSAPEMLGVPGGTSPSELLLGALNRERHWRKEIALEPDPDEREWMSVMLTAYSNLRNQIAKAIYEYEKSKNFLSI